MNTRYAGFWIRALAHLIDFITVNGVELILEYGISLPLGLSSFFQQIVGIVITLALSYWYYCRFQVLAGTTLGKNCFGIFVLNDKAGDPGVGGYLTHGQSVIRLFGYVGSYLMVGCGFLMAAFHPQKKAFHDLVAGTVSVCRPEEKLKWPALKALLKKSFKKFG